MELVSNPSRTGWTTAEAIVHELPLFRAARPDFATLMIGVNDWVQGVAPAHFRLRLSHLMNEMLVVLPNDKRLLVVNIPDFSVTPDGSKYARGRDISAGLTGFNQIIAEEAQRRGLALVDIFPASQEMRGDPDLVSADRLHPSAKTYAHWEAIIFPVAQELLGDSTHGLSGGSLRDSPRERFAKANSLRQRAGQPVLTRQVRARRRLARLQSRRRESQNPRSTP